MTDTLKLPEVAKSFLTVCKKCQAERYHKVLAHTNEKSAKVECEVCHAKKTFKLETPKKPKATGTKAGVKKVVKTAKSTADEYQNLKSQIGTSNTKRYSVREKFGANIALEHATFGLGFITQVYDHKIEVMFEDGMKSLVHNRT